MLYIDVGNTLRGGLRTGIQRVVRSLSYELAVNSGVETRLIAFDVGTGRYFALADPILIRSADGLGDIGREARAYFDFDAFAKGDIFFEPDSSWTEPLNRGALFRRLKAKGVIVVVLNHDAVPILLPEVCHPNTLVSFAETIADNIQYADYALATSARVARDLCAVAERFLGRSMSTRVIKLGADFAALPSGAGEDEPGATPLPELSGLRYLLSVGTIEPRKNHALLLQAFDRLSAKDAGLVIVGRKGWMADETLASLTGHPDFGKRVFWLTALDDQALLALYRNAYASVLPSHYEGYGLPVVEARRKDASRSLPMQAHCPRLPPAMPCSSAAVTARRSPRSWTSSTATQTTMRGSRPRRRASARRLGRRPAAASPRRSPTSPLARRMISARPCAKWCSCRCNRRGSIWR